MGCCVSVAKPVAKPVEEPEFDPVAVLDPVLPPIRELPPTPCSKQNGPENVSYLFHDIVDDKHMKYMGVYDTIKEPTLFWALGIENESYFMLTELQNATNFAN